MARKENPYVNLIGNFEVKCHGRLLFNQSGDKSVYYSILLVRSLYIDLRTEHMSTSHSSLFRHSWPYKIHKLVFTSHFDSVKRFITLFLIENMADRAWNSYEGSNLYR